MLEALGNLGDFIGGIAVVATLVYLAVQVGQNTRQLKESAKLARIQARDSSFQSFSDFRSKVVCNSDVAELYFKGLRDPDSLEHADRLRFNMLAGELFHIFETSLYRLIEIGSGDLEDSIRQLGVDPLLRAPGMVDWWQKNRDEFRQEFVDLIEDRLARIAQRRP